MPAMVLRLAAMAAVLLTAFPARGQEEAGGARLVPPAGFRRIDDALARGSVALVPLVNGEAPRSLVAVFTELREDEPATLVVGRVDKPLVLDAGVRSAAASAIAGHFRGELDLEVVVDRPAIVQGASVPRLEARAHVHLGRGGRAVRFAFVPAGPHYFVLVASLPAEREAELEEAVTRAFDSFAPPAAAIVAPPQRNLALRAAAFGIVGVLVALALRLGLRRRKG
jgi:hypothetical protein